MEVPIEYKLPLALMNLDIRDLNSSGNLVHGSAIETTIYMQLQRGFCLLSVVECM